MKKIIVLSSCLSLSSLLFAAPIEQRNLSSSIDSSSSTSTQQSSQFWELRQDIQQLQTQIRQLRGQIEEQDNQIEQLTHELKNRYTDLDQRLELLNQKVDPESNDDDTKTDDTTQSPTDTKPEPAAAIPANTTAPNTTKKTTAASTATAATVTQQQHKITSDQDAYNLAYDAYKQGGAAKAIAAMENFIKKYPTSPYVSHAYYWLGEFNLSLSPAKFNQAKENFEIVAGNYPKSAKAPAALYRLSEIAKNVDKDIPKAREYYLKLIQNYANSKEAKTAKTAINL